MPYIFYPPLLTLIILLYFRLALHFNIIDKPNFRSSHRVNTIRGGGVIFPIAILLQCLTGGFDYLLFTAGLILISAISFYDDVRPLSNKIRLVVHLLAVSLLFMQADLLGQPSWLIALAYILVIGTINAYNFMDGINGITGAYSLITLVTLYIINEMSRFIKPEWLVVSILALLVFNFFNFRQKAKCFAGDVGSVSIAFIIIFFLLLLLLKSAEVRYIGLLLVYGLDSVTTILSRLIRRENIFQAHRSHFYQFLVNVKGWPPLKVSTLYVLTQMVLNFLIVLYHPTWLQFLFAVLVTGLIFVIIRYKVEGESLFMVLKP